MRHLVAATLLTALPAAGQADTRLSAEAGAVLQEGLTTTAREFILPAYEDWHDANTQLTDALSAYCAGSGDLSAAQQAFADAFLGWQRAAIIQIGPIMEAEGPMRVQLWPDPKGFARRAMMMAKREADPALLGEGGLEERSIALVNLTGLEDLLYGDLPSESYGCDLATAIARYQSDLSEEVVSAWTDGAAFRSDFDTAVDGNDRYASVDDLIRELISGVVVYADRLRKMKIQRGLGTEPGETWPERTEAVQSGLGLESIATGFRALSDLYELPYGFFDMTAEIGGEMNFYMLGETAAGIADTLMLEDRPLTEIVEEDGERAAALRGFGDLTLYHEEYLKTGLPRSIGLTTGFTSADGD